MNICLTINTSYETTTTRPYSGLCLDDNNDCSDCIVWVLNEPDMKKLILIPILLLTLGVYAQIRTDTVMPIRIDFKQEQWAKVTKLQVAVVNVAAMLILRNKYSWDKKTQSIVTPLVIGGAMAFTFTKAIQYNRKKKLRK